MNSKAQTVGIAQPFVEARLKFDSLLDRLASAEMGEKTHSQVESVLFQDGMEVLRSMFQGWLNAQGGGKAAGAVYDSECRLRTHIRQDGRSLMSVFGPVRLSRQSYGARGQKALRPLDAKLNMPQCSYSLGVRRRVVEESAKVSFDESVGSVLRTTGATVAKRQAEELTVLAARDFDAFYAQSERAAALAQNETSSILVITTDAKGIVMRPDDLREATRKLAAEREHKLTTRLSKGEKRNAKRMAQVASVYTIAPYVRTPDDVIGDMRPVRALQPKRPRPEHKRVWASVKKEPKAVIAEAFSEAKRRDPHYRKTWVALVDGNLTQADCLLECMVEHHISVIIVIDFIHALEYLWKAARALVGEGPESEEWVKERAALLLHNKASLVAAGARRSATHKKLTGAARVAVDKCADYLLANASRMRYGDYLQKGLPISTGVIEGACRHLVKDRMDLTGARWRLERAEAVLQLRALRSSGDFDAYWDYHEQQEHERNHKAMYLGGIIPQTILPSQAAAPPSRRRRLAVVPS